MRNLIFLTIFALLTSFCVNAKSTKVQGDYELHYNVFPSVFLTPEVAKSYKIKRSKKQAFVNISVLKNQENGKLPVEADVMVEAKNLLGQRQNVELRIIKESDEAIYYIGQISVNHREVMNIQISALPEGSSTLIKAKLSKEFYTD